MTVGVVAENAEEPFSADGYEMFIDEPVDSSHILPKRRGVFGAELDVTRLDIGIDLVQPAVSARIDRDEFVVRQSPRRNTLDGDGNVLNAIFRRHEACESNSFDGLSALKRRVRAPLDREQGLRRIVNRDYGRS